MAAPLTYKIIGVSSRRVVEEMIEGSPAEGWLCEFGKRRSSWMVIRYFPSRKGWRILDLRNAQYFIVAGRHRRWVGQVRSKYYPTEDAAVMAAMHLLGCTPATT